MFDYRITAASERAIRLEGHPADLERLRDDIVGSDDPWLAPITPTWNTPTHISLTLNAEPDVIRALRGWLDHPE